MTPGLTCHKCNAPSAANEAHRWPDEHRLGLQHVTCPKRANNRAWKQRNTLARIEDLAFMADTERREKALR